MIDEMDNVKEFNSLEDAKEFVKAEEPAIINYSVFYRAPAGLYISTEIAAKGQLLAYGYNIMNQ